MGVEKEAFVDLQEKYEKVKKLIEEDSKGDPENEPYLSKYAARQLLISMKANLEKLMNQSTERKNKLTAMSGIVWFYLGLISVDTEDLSTGETELNKAINLVEEHSMKPEFVLIVLNSLNQLGILWSQRDDVEKSKVYLERSQKLYQDFKDLNVIPVSFNDLFKSAPEESEPSVSLAFLEKTHTLTLYYLAQVYGNLKDALKSAIYCHITLKRQLEFNDYEHIDWALNAATLSQFFMEKNGFKQARHHLAAASYMLAQYEEKLAEITEHGEEYEAKLENFKHRSADVARCWAKYGLLLLSSSKDRLLHHTDDEETSLTCSLSSDLAQLQLAPNSNVSTQDLSDLFFPSLDLYVYESQITDQFVLTFDDARAVFLSIQAWLNDAQLYYTLDNHASDYVQIIQDISQMFNYLAFFEDNPERQSKMHKRRIDHLEEVVKELNPTYYLQVCRQIWYELSEAYITILEIKLDKLRETSDRPTPHALVKINFLIEKSIEHFTNFLDSIKELTTENQEIPPRIAAELERPILKAYFHIAVLYGKFITPDKSQQLKNNKKSLEYFQKLCNYCDTYEEAKAHVITELSVSKEMVSLLPLKLIKISQEIETP